jgi:preprotein translocase subunit SecD
MELDEAMGRRMRSKPLTAIIAAVVAAAGSAAANADDIALSLVHAQARIDIPVSALKRVEAHATFAVRNPETGEVHEHPSPEVEVCFSKDIRERVCELTQKIVGQPIEIVIDCATVSKPIVREPLCTRPCFLIGMGDLADTNALAQRIRRGTNRTCAPSS